MAAHTPTVLELIQRRITENSQPGKRTDPYRLALVVEGGGMRGVVSAGMAAAIESLGLLHVFDDVVGASAGALGLPFLLAGQAVAEAPMFIEDLTDPKFISLWRAFGSRDLMNLDYLIHEVMTHKRPLNAQAMRQSGINLHILTTDAKTGKGILHSNPKTLPSLKKVMKATALIPGISGMSVRFKGRELIDGCFAEFIPLNAARSIGATHCLTLLNLPTGQEHGESGFINNHLVVNAMKKLGTPVAEVYPKLYERDNAQLRKVRAANPRRVLACNTPPDGPRVPTLCRDGDLLWQGLEYGFKALCDLLGYAGHPLPAPWAASKASKAAKDTAEQAKPNPKKQAANKKKKAKKKKAAPKKGG